MKRIDRWRSTLIHMKITLIQYTIFPRNYVIEIKKHFVFINPI